MQDGTHQILLTGGTGSFGRAFVSRLLRSGAEHTIRVYSRDELKQYEMARAFGSDPRLRFFLGDVRERDRLARAMHGVDVVVHAAALKHVPACEYNPAEAVKTNVLGAQNVIDAAIDAGVARTIALSTDKAVSPANLYGATKLCAEKLFVHGNVYAGSRGLRFSCVRYGNVMGSRGSVIPLFLEQARTGVLTLTDVRMTRFWMSLGQAVEFVLQSLSDMRGGEIFVPRIPSMRLVDLARAVAPRAMVKEIGVRPGEKIHEVLLTAEESSGAREFPTHFVIGGPEVDAAGQRATKLPDGFVYASDTNTQWLSVERLRELVRGLESGNGAA
ncbi:MAG TPA: UDP-N-acetylglucosamine 4,6-dehydratase (inverting) [Myxococcota bacterium]|jgi:UDP-N-acetylglucosamine 4,6-dehydratase|nr:UDP-N-acetylglucosamine 4,6-dehydratase (inverting) [Myxococcota bacterium]